MKSLIVVLLFMVTQSTTVLAWWSSEVDTVEIRYPDSGLKEQYQTFYWGGNETTYRYGFYRSWYENGIREWEGQYEADNKCGTWVRWDSAGIRTEEIPYLNGLKHGTEIKWNSNGTIRTRLHYRYGKLHGLCTWSIAGYSIGDYYNNPNLTLESEAFYLDGEILVVIVEKGTKDHPLSCSDIQSPYYNSGLDLWIEWNLKECAFFVGRKVDGKRDGLWVLWTKAGDMKRAEYYDMGEVVE